MLRVRGRRPGARRAGAYDLLLVDGPPFFYGRDGSLPLADDLLAPGAVVVVNDYRRADERRTVVRWLRTYPGLRPVVLDPAYGGSSGHGVALLLHGASGRRRSVRAVAGVAGVTIDCAWWWRHVRWKLRAARARLHASERSAPHSRRLTSDQYAPIARS